MRNKILFLTFFICINVFSQQNEEALLMLNRAVQHNQLNMVNYDVDLREFVGEIRKNGIFSINTTLYDVKYETDNGRTISKVYKINFVNINNKKNTDIVSILLIEKDFEDLYDIIIRQFIKKEKNNIELLFEITDITSGEKMYWRNLRMRFKLGKDGVYKMFLIPNTMEIEDNLNLTKSDSYSLEEISKLFGKN